MNIPQVKTMETLMSVMAEEGFREVRIRYGLHGSIAVEFMSSFKSYQITVHLKIDLNDAAIAYDINNSFTVDKENKHFVKKVTVPEDTIVVADKTYIDSLLDAESKNIFTEMNEVLSRIKEDLLEHSKFKKDQKVIVNEKEPVRGTLGIIAEVIIDKNAVFYKVISFSGDVIMATEDSVSSAPDSLNSSEEILSFYENEHRLNVGWIEEHKKVILKAMAVYSEQYTYSQKMKDPEETLSAYENRYGIIAVQYGDHRKAILEAMKAYAVQQYYFKVMYNVK